MEELRGSGEEWIEGPGVGSMLKTREAVGAIWLGGMDRKVVGRGRIPRNRVSGWRRKEGNRFRLGLD